MPFDITYAHLDGRRLDDGDAIRVLVTNDACGVDLIQIGIQLGPNVTWWKGVELNGGQILAQAQDNQFANFGEIPLTTLQGSLLHLWKAKLFGTRTDIYVIDDALLHMQGGNRYIFQWIDDDITASVIND